MSIKYDDKHIVSPGYEHEYTLEEAQDLLRCEEDILYFFKFVKIVTLDRGKQILGDLIYDFQKEIVEMFYNERNIALMLGRQMGKSTIVAACCLHYAIFNNDKFIGIASNNANNAKEILRRTKIMYECLPVHIKPAVVEGNKHSIEFTNGTRIEVAATTENAFRGRSLNCLVLDELAHVHENKARAFWIANYAALSSSNESKIIVISTPNGLFNLFHEIYSKAEQGLNSFKHYYAPWWRVPWRDEKGKKEQLEDLGEQKFNQEHNCHFLGSSSTVINTETLENLDGMKSSPLLYDLNKRLRVYKKPESGKWYIMGVDCAKGTGEHYSTIQIFRVDSVKPYIDLEQVAVFECNKTETYEFSSIVNRLSIYYNGADILCENNGEGSTITQNIGGVFENPNLYNSGQTDNEIGIRATTKTKPQAVILMKKLLEDKSLKIYDERTIKQLSNFIEKNRQFYCKNTPDDLVSALYWLCYAFSTELFDDVDLINNNKEEEVDEDIWGILTDIDDYYFLDEDNQNGDRLF